MTNRDFHAFLAERLVDDEASNNGMLAWLETLPETDPNSRFDPAAPTVLSTTREATKMVSVPIASADPRVEQWAVRWDVLRARRHVEIAERLLDLHEPNEGWVCGRCVLVADDGRPVPEPYPCATLRTIAWQYDTHADYDETWDAQDATLARHRG